MRDHYERMSDDLISERRRADGLRKLLDEVLSGFSPVDGAESYATLTVHKIRLEDLRRRAGLLTTGGGANG